MTSPIRRRIAFVFGAMLALFAVIVVLTYVGALHVDRAAVTTLERSQVLLELEQALSAMRDAETGQRGYLLTFDESYLDPYRLALGSIDRHQAQLRKLESSPDARVDPQVVRDIRLARQLMARRLGLLEQGIQLRRVDGPTAARQFILTGRGKAAMDSLRAVVADVEGRYRALFAADNENLAGSGRSVLVLISALSLLGLLLLAATFAAVLRAYRERVQREQALEQERAELEQRVRERTADLELQRTRAEEATLEAEEAAAEAEASALDAAEALRARVAHEQAARASDLRYRTLVDQIKDYAIFATDPEARVVSWNQGVKRVLGYDEDEFIGMLASRIFTPEDVAAGVPEAELDAARREGSASNDRWMMKKGGVRFFASGITTPLRDDAGNLVGYSKVMRDFTEQKQADESLAQAQRMEAVGRLAGGVAHDLNNMLTAILGNGRFLERSLHGDEVREREVAEIIRAAERSAGLTRSLLAFARRDVVQPRRLDLNTMIRDMERVLRPLVGENVQLEVALRPDLGLVMADRAALEQVILNLVLNARDAMPRGGRLAIDTSVVDIDPAYVARHPGADVRSGRYVRLMVSDSGHGMDPATLSRVFEPFFTTKPMGQGTGLGLSTVHGTVTQARGFVVAYSEPGIGSVFTVYLPQVDGVEAAPTPKPATRPTGGHETVLVVEDERVVRDLASRALQEAGYRTLEAATGADALALLERFAGRVHLVVTDVVMPGMSGRDLADRIEELRSGTRMLFMSGFTGDDVARRGLVSPGVPFLQKPWTPDGLVNAVRQVLDGQR